MTIRLNNLLKCASCMEENVGNSTLTVFEYGKTLLNEHRMGNINMKSSI